MKQIARIVSNNRHSSQAQPLRSASWKPAFYQNVMPIAAKAGFQIARDSAGVWNDGCLVFEQSRS
jgi:hypothetical protein